MHYTDEMSSHHGIVAVACGIIVSKNEATGDAFLVRCPDCRMNMPTPSNKPDLIDLIEYGKAIDSEWTPEMHDAVLDELAEFRERFPNDGHLDSCEFTIWKGTRSFCKCTCGKDDRMAKLRRANDGE